MRGSWLAAAAVLVVAGCSSSGSPAAPTSSSPSSAVGSPSPSATPSGPVTAAAGETLAAFWARAAVSPVPPAGFLDAYAGIRLPSTDPAVHAAVRTLAGRDWALDHLDLSLSDAGVLGAAGLSGATPSIVTATARGLTSLSSSLVGVSAAKVVSLTGAQATEIGSTIVVLRVTYSATVGTYSDGTTATAPPPAAKAQAVVGRLVTDRLLGTYLYANQVVDCASATADSPVAKACGGV